MVFIVSLTDSVEVFPFDGQAGHAINITIIIKPASLSMIYVIIIIVVNIITITIKPAMCVVELGSEPLNDGRQVGVTRVRLSHVHPV